jgi:hypothetical protein
MNYLPSLKILQVTIFSGNLALRTYRKPPMTLKKLSESRLCHVLCASDEGLKLKKSTNDNEKNLEACCH